MLLFFFVVALYKKVKGWHLALIDMEDEMPIENEKGNAGSNYDRLAAKPNWLHILAAKLCPFLKLVLPVKRIVVISYIYVAIDTTAIGFKRRKVYISVLIKTFTHPVNIPKPPQNVVSSSSALANSPAFVCPSRTPTSA
nr:transcription regulator [Tanacetum cinerariifolium]